MARTSSLRREPHPAVERAAIPSHERPVDLVHLSHQTMGDAALEREILGLLGRQIASFAGRLDLAPASERVRVAHSLKGAALNVGAFRLAKAAETLEHTPDASDALADFETEMAVVAAFVARLLRCDPAAR